MSTHCLLQYSSINVAFLYRLSVKLFYLYSFVWILKTCQVNLTLLRPANIVKKGFLVDCFCEPLLKALGVVCKVHCLVLSLIHFFTDCT